jgi:hypothetical protein
MQFDPAPLRTAGPVGSRAGRLAQTLLTGSSPDRSRENHLRTLVREDRLREQENQRRRAALDASTPLASPAHVIRCGERRMEIGSRAFERGQVRRHAGEQAAATRKAFREALHEARRPYDEVRGPGVSSSSEHGVKAAPTPWGGRESARPAGGSPPPRPPDRTPPRGPTPEALPRQRQPQR